MERMVVCGMLWKEKYRLGISEIDDQHKELFLRVEAFLQTLRYDASWNEKVQRVNETLAFMREYVVEHFRDEENFQQSIGYPGFEDHRKIHKEMVDYVLQVSADYEKTGCDEQLIQQFAGRLLAWLINHVAAADQRITDYAKETGVYQYDQ